MDNATVSTNLNFGQVIIALKMLPEAKMTRAGWNGKGMFITLIGSSLFTRNSETEDMQSFIAIKSVNGSYAPWQPSQSDMLADDWEYVKV